MQRFKNILVVVDEKTGNRAVVERAVTLAQRNQARLTVGNTVSGGAGSRLAARYCSVLTVKPDGFVTPVRLDE